MFDVFCYTAVTILSTVDVMMVLKCYANEWTKNWHQRPCHALICMHVCLIQHTLKTRRLLRDVTEYSRLRKVMKTLIKILFKSLVELNKLVSLHATKFFFSSRVINEWNMLSEESKR